jgi:hypothetical protein
MKNIAIISCIVLVVVSFSSCKKDKVKGCMDPISINYDSKAEEDDGTCEYAGTGGNTTIVAYAVHHSDTIINGDSLGYMDTAYVKFNAIESPGLLPSNYDLVIPGDSGEDHIHLEGLKRGKYFILMTGWDIDIGKRVIGGIPYVLNESAGEVDLKVPVSED